MTLNRVKLGHTATFMKYLDSVVSLIFLPKTSIWNKITFSASNSLNFAELVENELMNKEYFQKILPIFIFLASLSLLIVKILRAYN